MPKKIKAGKLSGPSHKKGGILLEAEGGEYIIKKSSVKKIGKRALDKVNKMRGVTYDRIDEDHHGAGVLAQELEEIAPELVQAGEYKSVAYGNLTAYLVEAIKELNKKVDSLQQQLED